MKQEQALIFSIGSLYYLFCDSPLNIKAPEIHFHWDLLVSSHLVRCLPHSSSQNKIHVWVPSHLLSLHYEIFILLCFLMLRFVDGPCTYTPLVSSAMQRPVLSCPAQTTSVHLKLNRIVSKRQCIYKANAKITFVMTDPFSTFCT